MAAALRGAKQAMRESMAAKLRSISEEEVKQQSVLVFSMGDEIDTHDIAREILSSGRKLYVPKIKKGTSRTMHFLQIHDIEDLNSLRPGVWGIKEPGLEYAGRSRRSVMDEDSEALDLILLPGVAFDYSLARLGHGRGYYDQFINNYAERCKTVDCPLPTLLALSMREQVLPSNEIPMGEHDKRMHGLITPDGVIEGDRQQASTGSIAGAASLAIFDAIAGPTAE